MRTSVLHVCDKFGVAGSSIHGVSRLFSWWFPRFDAARFDVSLVGLKREEPASRSGGRGSRPATGAGPTRWRRRAGERPPSCSGSSPPS